jgi:hypothetical protein
MFSKSAFFAFDLVAAALSVYLFSFFTAFIAVDCSLLFLVGLR